jgi:mono/diheme cytochrome c family protein
MTKPKIAEVRSALRAPRELALVALVTALAGAGCQPGDQPGSEYMPDMARSRAYKAYTPHPTMHHGITLQKPVAGTIARGHSPLPYGGGAAEAERAGAELANPIAATPANLHKGKALYEIYCLVCHGADGKGDGPIASKIPPPPPYRSNRLLGYPVGRLFHVISRGAGRMPAYATQLSVTERWLVATYVRSELQSLPQTASAPPSPSPGWPPSSASSTPGAP